MTIKEQSFINLLRVYKHDFLNHLQVIQGYLQLKKTEEALTYLKEAIIEIEKHGSIMKLQLSSVSYWLLSKELEQRELGITMDLDCNTTLSTSIEQEELILSFLKSLVPVITEELGKTPYEQRKWGLSFTGQRELKLVFTLPKGNEVDWQGIFEDRLLQVKGLESTIQHSIEENFFICQLELKVR